MRKLTRMLHKPMPDAGFQPYHAHDDPRPA